MRKLLILTIFLMSFLLIGVVSAVEDNSSTQTVTVDENSEMNVKSVDDCEIVQNNQNYYDEASCKESEKVNCQVKTKTSVDKNGMVISTKKKPQLIFKVAGKTLKITKQEYYKIKSHKYDGYNRNILTGEYYVIKKKMKTVQRIYFYSIHKNKYTAIKMQLKKIRPFLKSGYVITGGYISRCTESSGWKVVYQLTRKYFIKRLPIYWHIGAGDGHVELVYGAYGINYFRKGDFHTEAIYSPRYHRYCYADVTKYF